MNQTKTLTEERIAKIRHALGIVFTCISNETTFKFTDIIRSNGLSWSSGSHSLGAILRDKLKIIAANGKGKPMIFTEEFKNKYAEMTPGEIAKIVYRYMENWVTTPRVRKEEEEVQPGSLTEGDTTLLELTELEVYALKQILNERSKFDSTAVGMIAADIKAKLP